MLRRAGLVLLPLIVVEGVLGILAAGPPGPGVSSILVAHLLFGAGLLGLSGWVVFLARRQPNGPARYAAALTFGAIASATTVGSVFLILGNSSGALLDRGLGLLALAGAAIMIGWGSAPLPDGPDSAVQ